MTIKNFLFMCVGSTVSAAIFGTTMYQRDAQSILPVKTSVMTDDIRTFEFMLHGLERSQSHKLGEFEAYCTGCQVHWTGEVEKVDYSKQYVWIRQPDPTERWRKFSIMLMCKCDVGNIDFGNHIAFAGQIAEIGTSMVIVKNVVVR
jgi:hypothetical protein